MSSPTTPILILDNGSHTLKAGLSTSPEPLLFPNSIARSRVDKRTYVGGEIGGCRDFGGLVYRRPFERGILTAWECEKMIFDKLFAQLSITPSQTSLLITEPYLNLPSVAETYDQMIFEEWEFDSYYRCNPASLIPHSSLFGQPPSPVPSCMLLLDLGYSASWGVPLRDGRVLENQIRRQWNMMDETYIMERVREECCYVSMDWRGDLELCKRNPKNNPIVQQYHLPSYTPPDTRGYILSGPHARAPSPSLGAAGEKEEQVLWMGNERFTVPEVLFSPGDIGLKQQGLAEMVAGIIGGMPEEERGMFWGHIGLFGGLAGTEDIGERLDYELRELCPTEYEVGLYEAEDPITPTYYAAQTLTSDPSYLSTYPLPRSDYLEYGSLACRRRFAHAASLGGVVRPGDVVVEGGLGGLKKLKRSRGGGGGKKGGKKGKGKRRQRFGTPTGSGEEQESTDEEDLIMRKVTPPVE